MTDADLDERDLKELARTIGLAFGGERPYQLTVALENLVFYAEENARKRHARLMRGTDPADDQARMQCSARLLEQHRPLYPLVMDVWQYLATHELLEARGSCIQISGLRISRAE